MANAFLSAIVHDFLDHENIRNRKIDHPKFKMGICRGLF